MFNENIKLTGHVSIKKYNADGILIDEKEVQNLVVSSGKEFIASRLISDDLPPMQYMAVGDDSTATSLGQTSLQNELGRVATTGTVSTVQSRFDAVFGPGVATGSIVEAGIFNTTSTAIKSFNGSTNVNSTTDQINITNHGFSGGDLVTYTNGGATSITGLSSSGVYAVIVIDADNIQLAEIATPGTPIDITATSGTTHQLSYGSMLCRTIFPVISKSSSETISISWVVTVG